MPVNYVIESEEKQPEATVQLMRTDQGVDICVGGVRLLKLSIDGTVMFHPIEPYIADQLKGLGLKFGPANTIKNYRRLSVGN